MVITNTNHMNLINCYLIKIKSKSKKLIKCNQQNDETLYELITIRKID